MYTYQQFGSSVCCLGGKRTAKGLGLFRSRQNGNPSPGLRRLQQRVLNALDEDLQNPYAWVRIPPSPQYKGLEKERIRVCERAHAPHAFFSIPAKGPKTLSRLRVLSHRKKHESPPGNTKQRRATDTGHGVFIMVMKSNPKRTDHLTKRKTIVEHHFPFGNLRRNHQIKYGPRLFLDEINTKKQCRDTCTCSAGAGVCFSFLTHNIKRVINIMGVPKMIEVMV